MRDSTSDDTLLTRPQAGDELAVADLAQRYSSKIYQLAFRYLHNREDAEEVTQDVLYKVYRKVGAFRGDAALSSWIYRITFNAAMSRLRTSRYQQARDEERQTASAEQDELGMTTRRDVADWSAMADENVLRSQLRRRVFRAVDAVQARSLRRRRRDRRASPRHDSGRSTGRGNPGDYGAFRRDEGSRRGRRRRRERSR